MPRAFALTDTLLAQHRSGALLCLARTARGASFSMRSERPASPRLVAAGVRSDALPIVDEEPSTAAEPMGEEEAPPSAGVAPARAAETTGPVVAVVDVRGLLASEVSAFDCGWSDGYIGDGGIVPQVAAAMADPSVVAVVLDMMSPGGDAMGLGEAATQLAALREASGKPVLVYARQACSAAYWLAAAAAGDGGIYVSESSDVGNVGCWCCHVDYSAANEKDGIKVTYIADPPGKVLGNPDEPLADAARARMQRDASETTARFISALTAYRPSLTADGLIALDGDTRRGAAAVAEGLADGVAGSLEDVIALAFARALQPPAVDTADPGVSMSSSKTLAPKGLESMRFSSSLLSAAGLAAGASDAAVEAALLPRLALAGAVLAQLGETDPTRALGKLTAKLQVAASAESLSNQLAAKSAETEAVKREKMVEAAVTRGALRSGQAFRWTEGAADASGNPTRKRELAKFLADMSTPALEGYLDGLPALHRGAAADSLPDTSAAEAVAGARGVDERTRRIAAANKIDPSRLANAMAAMFGGTAAQET